MKYGLYLPNYGDETSAHHLAELARAAEDSGWDGFFIWDHILASPSARKPMVDPWVSLAAAAMATERIRLGTTVTPVARRRPWKLARETVTLDHLSNGRLTLAVGLGEPGEVEFGHFGENPDPKVRAEKLDEGLAILEGLWKGKPFSFQGQHFQLEKTTFLPPALQTPRIPVWVGGFWPRKAPFRRAARWDGVFPLQMGGKFTPAVLADVRSYIEKHRQAAGPFDLVVMGHIPSGDPKKGRKLLADYEAEGMTWWLESLYVGHDSFERTRERILQGPPR
jgi:alkanesulfonate monooxygenase SsuD/methylene tetrahydromethanopterin reductase-like flavin-dependent oxidoreductase (luciferase family)